jgi:predicted 3-demethylubiquinone-9 3-methyltransferase (glyoxalase superfamily)
MSNSERSAHCINGPRRTSKEIEVSKITPHLWFDKEAVEAAVFYSSTLPNSRVTNVTTLHDTPSGDADVVSFELLGQPFMAISAGPLFKFTPAVSFLVQCRTEGEVDQLWDTLSQGGTALMPLDTYPFSERYGWTEDRYGLSWQVMHAGDEGIEQPITPTLMFVGDVVEGPRRPSPSIRRYSPTPSSVKFFATPTARNPTKRGRSSMPASLWWASCSRPWTAPATTTSVSTKPSRSWSTAIPRTKSTTTGTAFQQSPRPSSAGGSRTSTASRGRLFPPSWANY